MGKYLLKAGSCVTGRGPTAKKYNANDPNNRIIESDRDLAAMDPLKFERVREEVHYPEVHKPAVVEEPPASKLGAAAVAPKPFTPPQPTVSQQEDLEKMSVEALKGLAIEEEIDLKGATTKEAIIKAIRRANKPS